MILVRDINKKKNEIFMNIQKIIEQELNYDVKVVQETEVLSYPCVVFTCRSNQYVDGTIDESRFIKHRSLGIEISIYSVKTGTKTAIETNDEISNIIMNIMENVYNCVNGGKTADISNINSNNARQTQLNYIYNWYS